MFINSLINLASRWTTEQDLDTLYKVKEVLGKGGNGKVYAGVRKKDGKEVAIKKIRKRSISMRSEQSVPLEVVILQQLQDVPGVISLLDYLESDGSYYIVMERFPCKDMFDYISDHHRGVPEQVARDMFNQIVAAVQQCRKKGIVHGDIKDENIVLNMKTKEVKLIDFGSSSLWTEKVQTKFRGTREYAPPEWFSARRLRAEGLTVWSLGILLYSMVCGDTPFQTDLQITQGGLTFPDSLSQAATSLIESCLDKNPMSRITLAELSRHSWLQDRRWQISTGVERGRFTDRHDSTSVESDRFTDRYFVTGPVYV
eukprot:GFUD01068127.1.p1 GENE.GFUD01068127.1~~GFUD01068127.1.p1  ORF type:complete len:313 (+),score=85.89 GFUD01068127.1:59-997(+)